VPPWDWRRGTRATTPAAPTPQPQSQPRISVPSGGAGFSCGSKRYCRQMSSCAEAQFYLRQCGLTRLDGDGDGVPCETLCR
jgi:hypothetical protein